MLWDSGGGNWCDFVMGVTEVSEDRIDVSRWQGGREQGKCESRNWPTLWHSQSLSIKLTFLPHLSSPLFHFCPLPSHMSLLPFSWLCFSPLSLALGGEVGTPRFTQYFRGSLSGLTIRPGRIETQKVISCLQACKEGLDINSLESLAKDIKVHGNKPTQHLKMSCRCGTNLLKSSMF